MDSSNNNQTSIDTDTLVGELLTRDLRSLPEGTKQVLLDAMYGDSLTDNLNLACRILDCSAVEEDDGDGRLVLYTDMMYNEDNPPTAVPFIVSDSKMESGPISDIDPDSDLDVIQVESHELEEEPDSSDPNYDDSIPPTVRNPTDILAQAGLIEATTEQNGE